MRDLLSRLHRTKLILTGLSLTVFGVLLLVIGQLVSDATASWDELIPWNELGGILIGGGILGIWIDHLFKREAAAANEEQLRQLLTEHAPVMRDAVLEAFAADTDDLKRIANPETLDRLATNSIALRLGSKDFAQDIYSDLKQQAVDAPERWTNASVDITLSPHKDNDEFFDVTIRWEYTTTPSFATRQFTCVGERDTYSEIAKAKGNTSAWYFKPDDAFEAESGRCLRTTGLQGQWSRPSDQTIEP